MDGDYATRPRYVITYKIFRASNGNGAPLRLAERGKDQHALHIAMGGVIWSFTHLQSL